MMMVDGFSKLSSCSNDFPSFKDSKMEFFWCNDGDTEVLAREWSELAPAKLTQNNLEQINPAYMEEMDIAWQMVQELEMTLSHTFMVEVDDKRNEVTENLCSTSCIEKVFKYRRNFNSEFLNNEEIFKKKLDAERRDISKLKELLSDKESSYWDAKRQIEEITLELNQVKTKLSKTKIRAKKYDYSSNLGAKMINVEIRGREATRLGYSEVKPPFNHNYSIMPKINTSVDDLLLKSDRRHEFTTGSNKPVSLTVDPILSDLNHSDDSEVCAEGLIVSGQSEEMENETAGRSTDCSVSSNKSQFLVPKVDFVGKFQTINIKPNEMIKNFRTKFVKTDVDVKNKCVLKSNVSPFKEKVNTAYSTITREIEDDLARLSP
ncbi:hypothetical protein R6Q57_019528 [Mikania cordata]